MSLNLHGDWTPRSSPPPLPAGEVQLWRVAVPESDRIPEHWVGLLTPEERERAARKRIPLDARRTLTSRACLRILLGGYLAVPPQKVALAANANGKPRIASANASATAVEFNVSHSGDWVLLAFTRDLAVGVDVECHRSLEFGELVESFFSPQERLAWASLAVGDQAEAFFTAWTRKEAYLKALGFGLLKPLDSFSVAFTPDATADLLSCTSDPAAGQRWKIASVDLSPGYACAVAVDSAATELRTFTFDFAGGSRSNSQLGHL